MSGAQAEVAASLLRDGRPVSCPLCGDVARYDSSTGLLVCGGPACPGSEVLDVDQVEAELEAAGRRWWQGLDGFEREILREPAAEKAARRVAVELLKRGVDPAVVEQILDALNARRDRPAPRPALAEILVAAAQDVAARRGRRAA